MEKVVQKRCCSASAFLQVALKSAGSAAHGGLPARSGYACEGRLVAAVLLRAVLLRGVSAHAGVFRVAVLPITQVRFCWRINF